MKTIEKTIGTGRNYGIDMLRLISMMYVVLLHVLGQGGVLRTAMEESVQYQFSWFLEMWAYCAVNIFGIISGYVGFSDKEKRYNYANYLVLWLQIVAYGAAVTLLCYFIDPDLVTKKDMRDMFFPLTNKLYWYFSAYTGLFFMIPLLNAGIRHCSKRNMCGFFVVAFLLFSVYENFGLIFEFKNGYSFIWLVILYILGAIIKKCEIGKNISGFAAFVGIAGCCVVSWAWKIYGHEFTLLEKTINQDFFETYLSPTHLCAAILHVIAFSKIKVNRIWQKMIAFAAPGAFAVYILNLQRFVWSHVMKDRFVYLADQSVHIIFIHALGFSLAFVAISVLLDYVRQKAFKVAHVNQAATYIVAGMKKILGRYVDWLLS